MTLHDRIEVAAIGGAHCLYRPSNGAIVLLNAESFASFEAFRNGGPADSSWHAAGLIGAVEKPTIEAVSPRDDPSNDPAGQSFALEASFGHPDQPVRVLCADAVLGSLLAGALWPLEVFGHAGAKRISIPGSADSFDLVEDGKLVQNGLSRAAARRKILDRVFATIAPVTERSALLHASAVRIAGRVVLLAGESGSGKTTLTARLVAAGAAYLADDLVALDREGQRVLGLPSALSLKAGSWPVLRQNFPKLDGLPVLVSRGAGIRYLPLPFDRSRLKEWAPASALVFPSYIPGENLSLTRLAPKAALALLVRSGSDPDGTPRRIAPLVRFALATPAVQMDYGDLDAAVDAVSNLDLAA